MSNFHRKYFIISAACIIILFGIYGVWNIRGARDNKKLPVNLMQLEQKKNEQIAPPPEDLENSYINGTYEFSFDYPKDFEASEFLTQEGNSVIVVKKKGGTEEFQILISSFDEHGPLTQERIKRDIPDIIIEQPLDVIISGIPAILFWSDDLVLGKTREVWFVHGAALYQISSRVGFDATLSRIMTTWEFDKN